MHIYCRTTASNSKFKIHVMGYHSHDRNTYPKDRDRDRDRDREVNRFRHQSCQILQTIRQE